ncbi:nucleoside hydrolase-like domain-containing protein [Novosphingobium sp.]|uniref:DUF1593 domain-containing protein n=1 Tax=Novosphingobium sp. TaxID=1874826 RepID=UPI003D0B1EEE
MATTRLRAVLAFALLIASVDASSAPERGVVPQMKSRLFVLTDIGADPDDTQSLIRLLLYSNEIDMEGLVAVTSVHQKTLLEPDSIRRVLRQYAQVQGNLSLHDVAYPTAHALLALVATGQPAYGQAAVGEGKASEGSRRIVAALKRPDTRPLWITDWGGANTLAQALFNIRETESPVEAKRLISKLRVYAISDQDDSGAWIRKEFPELFYIVSPGGYGAATWMGMSIFVDGMDNTTVSNGWLASHIQQGHGPLGAAYPDVAYGMEGDTPSFLALIPNGLNVPERPDWGGWGGRYTLRMPPLSETDPKGFNGGVPVVPESRPIWTNTVDTITPMIAKPFGRATGPTSRSYTGFRETLWRWRDDFQNDFAARMDWTVTDRAHANHPPTIRLAHGDHLAARAGDFVRLSALGTSDPDGDSLSYHWFVYPEAGTCAMAIPLSSADNVYQTSFTAPKVDRACDAHFILRVTDKGTPPLTRYGRVVVSITPK